MPTPPYISRRQLLHRCGMGMGALTLSTLLQDLSCENLARASSTISSATPLAARNPPFFPKAKRVIHFFLNGGPSHVDTFDPKPSLLKYANQPLPIPNYKTERKTGAAFPSPFAFKKYGQSGLEISDLFPHVAESADELCVIRSMQADIPNHEPSLMLMNCGDAQMSRPSLGAWVTYGLGTENQNLPGFIAMCPGGYPIKDAENWQAGFLPGVFQGTFVDSQHTDLQKLIENIKNNYVSSPGQRQQLDLLRQLNSEHQQQHRAVDSRLEARIQSFELAYRMQTEASDAFDIYQEPEHIRDMYGIGVHAR